jgi:cell division protease FtsH
MIISSALVVVYLLQSKQPPPSTELKLNEVIERIQNKQVEQVNFKKDLVEIIGTDKNTYTATIGSDAVRANLVAEIVAHNKENTTGRVQYTEEPASSGYGWLILLNILPLLLLVGFLFFIFRQMQAGGNKALSFGKSKAKLLSNQQKRVTFKDVAGVEEAKEELQEIIEFLKDPQKFQKLGGKIPKGVLMVGPPGTGKTLLAKAVAGEANVPFFSISGSDFVEMFVGVGASRVRDLFEQGKKNAPCIIFIDEIDAVGRHRGAGLGGGHDEREQTLNQLLVEMDGFEANEGVILMASTNRPDVLDPALLRPGRFDRRVVVGRPDVKGREGILKVHTKKIPMDPSVDIHVIARGTPGFTGADLANIVNEAALNAARYNKKVVTMEDFEIAKDKIMMGAERRSMVISDAEKKLTAYHEAGHTLVGLKVPSADPVHKVSIIPRGMALGVTQQLPEADRHSYTREYLMSQIAILMGGRIAEEIYMGEAKVTTGASNDIERATELARRMVCEFGMSSLGPLTFGKKDEQVFLGREIGQQRDYSEDTAIKIDAEVRKIIADQYEVARTIIADNADAMVRLAESLLEHETLDAEQIRRAVAGEEIPAPVQAATTPEGGEQGEGDNKEETSFNDQQVVPPMTPNNPATA